MKKLLFIFAIYLTSTIYSMVKEQPNLKKKYEQPRYQVIPMLVCPNCHWYTTAEKEMYLPYCPKCYSRKIEWKTEVKKHD